MSLYAAIKRALKDVLSNILDTPVSTRASEATLQSVLSQLDITLAELRDAITAAPPDNKTLADLYERLDSIRSQIDTAISTRASEATLASILGQLDLTLTELRDAIRGTGDKTITDLDSSISAIKNALSSIGTDKLLTVPDNPLNLDIALSALRDSLVGTENKTLTDLDSRLASVLGQLDITLTELRDAITAPSPNSKTLADLYERLDSIRTQLDTSLSTRASETTLASILGQIDITLSALRDAIRGAGNKTLTDVDASISTIKNALSSIGTDKLLTTPDNPSNLDIALSALRDSLVGTENKTLTDLDARLSNVLGQLDITLSQLRDALKPTRTLPVQELSSYSIPAGGIAEFTVDASETDGFSALVVAVKATYNASATQGVRVRWLYSPDGTDFDSIEEAEVVGNYEDIGLAAGASRVRTILIPLFMPYVKVQVVNLDTSYVVVVDAWKVLMR